MKYDVKDFTIDEKILLLTSKDWWSTYDIPGKLPEVWLSDGPNGLNMRKEKHIGFTDYGFWPATAMPNLCTIANSWNPEMAYLDGQTIADDAIEKNAHVLLGPGLNIKRTPLCGRNFEYMSEDPYLAGVMGKAFIEGVQDKGIGAMAKHYCVNNREFDRVHISNEVDERTLREIYISAFEIAIKAKPWAIMCSYNPVNGVFLSENKWLLTDVLRGDLGFEGVICSDWGATYNSERAAKAGLNLTVPNWPGRREEMRAAYDSGRLTEEEIDALVAPILEMIGKAHDTTKKVITTTKKERHENAVKIAREGAVLLKNEDNILPLRGGKIAVLGNACKCPPFGGGGSAYVETEHVAKPLNEEIALRLGDKAEVFGVEQDAVLPKFTDAFHRALESDTVIYCIDTNSRIELEGVDRRTLDLPDEDMYYLLELTKLTKNLVVVLHAGSAVNVEPFIDKVKAVLYVGFGGEGVQESTADLLTGVVSPSGKLSETFPICLEDTPVGSYRGEGFVNRYAEGIFVGYRYYDTFDEPVRFPFGFGLSYAEFAYSDLAIDKKSETDYDVSFTVTNTSDVDAKEIAQLYVRDPIAMVSRPQKELKGFRKIALKAGESRRVTLSLDARSFAYYSVPLKKWHVENGAFEIMIGASSRDIRLSATVKIALPETEQLTRV